MNALIVFSHLPWHSVWQRPQHLVTRFARRWPVLFVEEPSHASGPPRAEQEQVHPGVTVLRPRTPIEAGGFHDRQLPAIRPMLQEAVGALGSARYGVYTFTPMALPLMQDLDPVTIAYDCMDELAAFRFAPRQLPQREGALLRVANVVFTGGPSLYRSKRTLHHDVHCFPSSVDPEHFARGRDEAFAHPDLAGLPRPRLGFYGVIDERLDTELVRGMAALRPDWQFVFVGPVAKVDQASLPRAPNLHWMPKQPYEALPRWVAGWDLCLLPFAQNESTRFISPTKTLEYLAADKPVVSTPVGDVAALYGDVVRIAADAPSIVSECETLLAESDKARRGRVEASRHLVERTSWDRTAEAIVALLDQSSRQGLRDEARALLAGGGAAPRSAGSGRPREAECLVLGAGPTGLSAAYHYGRGATLLEREARVGGWCRSIEDAGFTFDCAGHIMFSNEPAVHELYRRLLGDNVVWQDREAWIYSKATYTRYPFQGSLYGLPPDVLKECLVGAIEARFGALAAPAAPKAHVDCCGDGTDVPGLDATCARGAGEPPRNFEEFILATWGRGIAKHFAIPYNRKLWTYPLAEMETSWLGGRVPLPDLEQMIEGALKPAPKPMGPNARFGYPRRGGFQALMDGFLPHLQGPLELRADVVRVEPGKRVVTLADGRRYRYEALVSTLPLPDLVRMIGDDAPAEVRAAAHRLRRVSVRCVNLGIGRADISDKHWIYYPEDTVFHRVFLQGNASPGNNPPGGFALICEISHSPAKPLPCTGPALIERCRRDLVRVGLIRDDDPILCAHEVDMPYAYVLYDHHREAAVRRIREWLAPQGVLLAGRYSEWAYYNSDHAFMAGRNAAERAAAWVASPPADAAIA
jgi:protoporphyrinogen oxidase